MTFWMNELNINHLCKYNLTIIPIKYYSYILSLVKKTSSFTVVVVKETSPSWRSSYKMTTKISKRTIMNFFFSFFQTWPPYWIYIFFSTNKFLRLLLCLGEICGNDVSHVTIGQVNTIDHIPHIIDMVTTPKFNDPLIVFVTC